MEVSGGRNYGLFITVSSVYSLILSYCSIVIFPMLLVYLSCWLYCLCFTLSILISS
jgi:hypothetical protein